MSVPGSDNNDVPMLDDNDLMLDDIEDIPIQGGEFVIPGDDDTFFATVEDLDEQGNKVIC